MGMLSPCFGIWFYPECLHTIALSIQPDVSSNQENSLSDSWDKRSSSTGVSVMYRSIFSAEYVFNVRLEWANKVLMDGFQAVSHTRSSLLCFRFPVCSYKNTVGKPRVFESFIAGREGASHYTEISLSHFLTL